MALKLLILIFLVVASFAYGDEKSDVTTTTPPPATGAKTSLYAELSLSSWQDSLDLNRVGVGSSHLIQTTTGICPGVGYRKTISPSLSWDVNGCAFLGISEINNDVTSPGPTSYSAKNNQVYGLESSVGILLSPGGIKHQFGIAVPFLLRHSSPRDAGSGTSFSSQTALQTGIELDTRFYSANGLSVDPKLAWFQTTHTMLWSLGMALDL